MKRGRYEVKKEEAMNSRDEGNEAEVRKKKEEKMEGWSRGRKPRKIEAFHTVNGCSVCMEFNRMERKFTVKIK